MNFNGMKYLGKAYHQQIKNFDREEVEEWVHNLGEMDAKSKNKVIEVDFGRRKSTYFPCGCEVTLWYKCDYETDNGCHTYKCDKHRRHKGWSTKGRQ